MGEIAAGGALDGRKARGSGVSVLVSAEKEGAKGKEEDDEDLGVEYLLEDDAIAAKVLKTKSDRQEQANAKPKKGRVVGVMRKKTSVVHVLFEPAEQHGSFKCRVSHLPNKEGHQKFVKAKAGVTSNLLQHAKTWHSDLLHALVKASNDGKNVQSEFDHLLAEMEPPTTSEKNMDSYVNTVSRGGTGFEKQLALLIMIIGNSLAFSLMDSRFFKDWLTVLGLSLPSEATIKKLLAPLYDTVREEQEDFIRNCGFFCVTFDMWTSIAKQKYLGTTFHSMDDEFNMFSAPLDLIPLSCSAYGEFVAMAIQSRIQYHKFDKCVFMASFSDSGSNCVLAKGILTPGDEEPCFHHTLKLMLDDVIGGETADRAVNATVAKDLLVVGLLVAIVRATPNLRNEMSLAAEKSAIDDLELIAANITRWEGRFNALSRFLEMKEALIKMHHKKCFEPFVDKSKNSFPADFLQPPFIQRLNSYKDLLERFHLISIAGQSQSEPTLSCVAHWVWSMEEILTENAADSSIMKSLKADLLHSWDRRMSVFVKIETDDDGEVSVLPNAIKAGILDARHSNEVQKRLSKDELVYVRDAIIDDTLTMCQKQSLHKPVRSAMEGSWEGLLSLLSGATAYEGTCLAWWRELKNSGEEAASVYVHFFRSVRIFLSMPAGSSPSECVFSSTTDMVTKKRNSLGDDTLEQMTIVRHFLRSDRYQFRTMYNKMEGLAKKQMAMDVRTHARAAAQEEEEAGSD